MKETNTLNTLSAYTFYHSAFVTKDEEALQECDDVCTRYKYKKEVFYQFSCFC